MTQDDIAARVQLAEQELTLAQEQARQAAVDYARAVANAERDLAELRAEATR